MPILNHNWEGEGWRNELVETLEPRIRLALEVAGYALDEIGMDSEPLAVNLCRSSNEWAHATGTAEGADRFTMFFPRRDIDRAHTTHRLARFSVTATHEATHSWRYKYYGDEESAREFAVTEGLAYNSELYPLLAWCDNEADLGPLFVHDFWDTMPSAPLRGCIDTFLADTEGTNDEDDDVFHKYFDASMVGYIVGVRCVRSLLQQGMPFRELVKLPPLTVLESYED